MTTTRGLAWPSTAGAKIGVDKVASESAVNLRRDIVMVHPLWILRGVEVSRERGDLIVLEAARHGLHHLVGEALVAVGLEPVREQSFGPAENVRDSGVGGAGAVARHAF